MRRVLFCLHNFVFILLLLFLLFLLQKLFTPVWNYPEYWDQVNDVFVEFNELPKNTVQVLFLGTSHVAYGISPIEMYREYGILAYNMGTSDQGFDSSLLALLEAFEKQKPSLVFLDVSKLFRDSSNSDRNKVFDNIKFGRNKIRFALADGNGYSIRNNLKYFPDRYSKLLPIYQYHTRWKNISLNSFSQFHKKKLFLMGYNIFSSSISLGDWKKGWITLDDDTVDKMKKRDDKVTFAYINKIYDEKIDYESPLYEPHIYEENYHYISAMKTACEQNGAKLILTKIPSKYYPQFYEGTWTKIKHNMTVEFANKMGLPFIDLKYDMDIDLDYTRDTTDAGCHLNLLGARKVTSALGQLIQSSYSIEEKRNITDIDSKLPFYDNLCWVCELQLETDFIEYIKKLKKSNRDLTVCFALSDTGLAESSIKDKEILTNFGFQTNFNKICYGDSFIGVADNGFIQYECHSNREQYYSCKINNNKTVKLVSSGWECGSKASIEINDTEFSLNGRGLNIIVYDKTAEMVIDSVCFDFLDLENGFPRRDIQQINKMRFDYQYYLYDHPEAVK